MGVGLKAKHPQPYKFPNSFNIFSAFSPFLYIWEGDNYSTLFSTWDKSYIHVNSYLEIEWGKYIIIAFF